MTDYVHVIEVADGDPVAVSKYSAVGNTVQFNQGDVVTILPWSKVTRIRRVDAAVLRRLADPDDPADDVSDEVRDVYDTLADPERDIPDPPEPGPEARTREAPPTDADGQPLDGPTADQPEPGVVRAGAGQEQVGDSTEPAATRTGAGRARETGGEPSAKELRAWAKETGLDVPASGPVPDDVKAAYAAAHTD